MQRVNSSTGAVAATFMTLFLAASPVWSHGGDTHAEKTQRKAAQTYEETAFGRPGNPKRVSRTVHVGMGDTMHFSPGEIRLKQGDSVKFVVSNDGKIMHEMVLGTMNELKAHANLMRKHPGMEHEEAYMAHVPPGKKEEVVWQFTKPGEFFYACLIPGHLEAGMIGKIIVSSAK